VPQRIGADTAHADPALRVRDAVLGWGPIRPLFVQRAPRCRYSERNQTVGNPRTRSNEQSRNARHNPSRPTPYNESLLARTSETRRAEGLDCSGELPSLEAFGGP